MKVAMISNLPLSEMEVLEKRMARLANIANDAKSQSQKIQTLTSTQPHSPPRKRKGKKAPIKFRDPETGNAWSGRGLTPVWLRNYEANGGKRSDLAV
jgi:DNA-binding protein H-NS